MIERGHLEDQALLRLMDGELDAGKRARVEEHLHGCAACTERLKALDVTSGDIGKMLCAEGVVASGDRLRERVRQGMQAAKRQPQSLAGTRWMLVPAVIVLPLVTALLAGLMLHRAVRREGFDLSGLAVPDSRLTPGETKPVALAELCAKGGDDFDPELPASVQQAVFQEYGINSGRPGDYQVDYLVSPQLGGTNSIQNLWPEPYGATSWNARAKDALEQRLRMMVCRGDLDLPSAQEAIRVNWIAAYRKYVGQR